MSDPELLSRIERLESALDETRAIATEARDESKKIYRHIRVTFWIKAAIWIAVIILPLLFIGPILDGFFSLMGAAAPGVGIFGLPDQEALQEALRQYQELQQ